MRPGRSAPRSDLVPIFGTSYVRPGLVPTSIVGKRAAVRIPVALTLAQLFDVFLAHLQTDAMKGKRPALHDASHVAIAQVGTDDVGG